MTLFVVVVAIFLKKELFSRCQWKIPPGCSIIRGCSIIYFSTCPPDVQLLGALDYWETHSSYVWSLIKLIPVEISICNFRMMMCNGKGYIWCLVWKTGANTLDYRSQNNINPPNLVKIEFFPLIFKRCFVSILFWKTCKTYDCII